MKTYRVQYHLLKRSCCGGKSTPSQTIIVQANSPSEARDKVRKKAPGARFELVEEVNDG